MKYAESSFFRIFTNAYSITSQSENNYEFPIFGRIFFSKKGLKRRRGKKKKNLNLLSAHPPKTHNIGNSRSACAQLFLVPLVESVDIIIIASFYYYHNLKAIIIRAETSGFSIFFIKFQARYKHFFFILKLRYFTYKN